MTRHQLLMMVYDLYIAGLLTLPEAEFWMDKALEATPQH